MSRLVVLYPAPNAYIAEALRGALAEAGIGCVVRSNEIPLYTGFNFGASTTFADVLVDDEDLERAREVMAELAGALCGEEHDCETVYPPRINVHSNHALVAAVLIGWIGLIAFYIWLGTLLGEPGAAFFVLLVVLVFLFVPLGMAVILIALNWPMAARTLSAFAISLVMLVVLPVWLAFALARRVFDWLIQLPKLLAAKW